MAKPEVGTNKKDSKDQLKVSQADVDKVYKVMMTGDLDTLDSLGVEDLERIKEGIDLRNEESINRAKCAMRRLADKALDSTFGTILEVGVIGGVTVFGAYHAQKYIRNAWGSKDDMSDEDTILEDA